MRVCDFVADQLVKQGVQRIYGLMGGGAAGLNDGFLKNPNLQYIAMHHEQSAGHAAIGESKMTGKFTVVNPTTGCGGANCMTSLIDAWQDSVPVLFISGNVKLNQTVGGIRHLTQGALNLRKFGVQDHDIITMVKPFTKFATLITHVQQVHYALTNAITQMFEDRRGPAWIDVPADFQALDVSDIDKFKHDITPIFGPFQSGSEMRMRGIVIRIFKRMRIARRPLVLAGAGILDNRANFIKFVTDNNLPFVTSYGARDIMRFDHPLNVGAIGIKGSRAGNLAIQNCDFLLILGCSLNVSHTGYNPDMFAPNAEKAWIEDDVQELNKYTYSKVGNILINFPANVTLDKFYQFFGECK